jgi:outer membrane protein OmpA-like peptidoglycan-associated protein
MYREQSMARAVLRIAGMKSLLIALAVGGTAVAGPAPDFVDNTPRPPLARRMAASIRSDALIEPSDVVTFNHDSNGLRSDALDQVDTAAQWLRDHPDYNIVLEGHTDEIGDPTYNAHLAYSRAAAIKARLTQNGIDSNRVILVAFGERGVNERRVLVYATRVKGETIAANAIRRGAARATWYYAGATFDMGPGT